MITPIRLVREHPLLTFVVLACMFGWWRYIAAAFGLGFNLGNNPLAPGLAALVVVACQGPASLSRWWRQLRRWRTAPAWYALAVLAPLAVDVLIVLINHGLGAPLPTTAQLGHWPELPIIFVVNLVVIGIAEEAGWVMGFVGNAAFQLVLLLMFQASGGQWSLAAVWHGSLNTFGGSFFFTMATGTDHARLELLLAGVYALLAITWLFSSRHHRSRPKPDGASEATDPTAVSTIRA